MKKTITLSLALLLLTTASYAQDVDLVVTRTSGPAKTFRTEDIASITFVERAEDNDGWQSLGRCRYTDVYALEAAYLTQGRDLPCSYYVEVQESTTTDGLYRLVDPYSPENYPYADDSCYHYDSSVPHYLEVNAADPEGVYINLQATGLSWFYYGEIYAYSLAALNLDDDFDLETLKRWGMTDTMVNGRITFPEGALLVGMTNYNSAYYFYANYEDGFLLDLNDKENE